MADNISIASGSGNIVGVDEVSDGTLGTVKIQYVKLMDGTLDGTAKSLIKTTTPGTADPGLVTRDLIFDSNGGIVSSSVVQAKGSYGTQYAVNVNVNAQQRATYHFIFKPAATAITATIPRPWASLYHSGSSVGITKIRRIFCSIYSNTAASQITLELSRITSSSGAPITTIGTPDAAEANPLTIGTSLPATITGSTTNIAGSQTIFVPIMTGSNQGILPLILYDWQEDGETKPFLLRSNISEGWVIDVTGNVSTTIGMNITAIVTEE